jgi:hypothetical protein
MSAVTSLPTTPPTAPSRSFAPLAGGLAYTGAWLAGLAVAPAGTDVTSSGAQVRSAVAGHLTGTAAQYLLTEVVAAAALAVTVTAVAGFAADGAQALGAGRDAVLRAARALRLTALAAAAISVAQGALGLVLVQAAHRGDDTLTGALAQTINRADGVKMLLLAALAVAGLRVGRAGLLPRWLSPVAVGLAVTVVASGVGYLLLVPALATAAYASLPLLLLWVTGAGIAVARRVRSTR